MRPLSIQEVVWQAADELMVQGVRPTVANVREITQRGSAGTINDALKEWWQQLAKRVALQQQVQAQIPEQIVSSVQHLWQQALVAGEAAFNDFKQQAEDKVIKAEELKIAALERQQRAENLVQTLEAKLTQSQNSERLLQTQLATEIALRQQIEQQLSQSKQQSSDFEQQKNQLEKEMALLAAQYQHQEQQLSEKNQHLERDFLEYKSNSQQQLAVYQQNLQACEIRLSHSDLQLLQAQNELRLLQQQLEATLQENALLKRQTANVGLSKRDALKAKLQRY